MASDVINTFLCADEFAEQVVYRPRSGRARTITAIVDRNPPDNLGNVENTVSQAFVVMVANDDQDGIPSRLLDTGGDAIDVSDRTGETVKTRRIVRLVDDAGGMLTLEVR
jgi:hypothetical protein